MGNEVCWHLKKTEKRKEISCRTVYFTAPHKVEVKTEVLAPPQKGQSLYSSRLMAISAGTEKQFYSGNFIRGRKADPGIDFSGGEFSYPFSYGYINILENTEAERFFGFFPHTEKVFAERERLFPLSEELEDETALFIPHMETAISIIHDTKPRLGDRILITGAGVVGTLTQRILAGIMGNAASVFDINPEKEAWFPSGSFIRDRKQLEKGSPYDICIETSGSFDGLQTCIDHSGREGSVTVASWYGEKEDLLNLGGNFHWNRLKLKSSQVSNMGFEMGISWNKKRRLGLAAELLMKIETHDLLTHRYPLSEARRAYDLFEDKKAFYGLIALTPGG